LTHLLLAQPILAFAAFAALRLQTGLGILGWLLQFCCCLADCRDYQVKIWGGFYEGTPRC